MSQRDIRSLDIGMLRTFDALMRERSVSRAASRLFLSQPAVSASLNRLREAFGDPLFSRTSHGVEPTARALSLAAQVEKVLAGVAALMEDDAPFDPATSSRIFRIAGSDFPSRLVLPGIGNLLAGCGSQARIVWEPPGTAPLAERLNRAEIDLAMVARIRLPQDMEVEVLYEDHYVYVLRKGHPLAGQPVTLDSFCQVPQIFLGYGTSALDDLIDETLARYGRQRLAQIAVTSFAQIIHQLQHSDHAAVLGSRVAAQWAQHLHIQPLPFELPRYNSLMCWAARSASDMAVMWLRSRILELVRAA